CVRPGPGGQQERASQDALHGHAHRGPRRAAPPWPALTSRAPKAGAPASGHLEHGISPILAAIAPVAAARSPTVPGLFHRSKQMFSLTPIKASYGLSGLRLSASDA